MKSNKNEPQSLPDENPQINHIEKIEEPPEDKNTNPKQYLQQQETDNPDTKRN